MSTEDMDLTPIDSFRLLLLLGNQESKIKTKTVDFFWAVDSNWNLWISPESSQQYFLTKKNYNSDN